MQLPPGDEDAAEDSKTCSEGDSEFTSLDPSSSSPSRPESGQKVISNSLKTSCHIYDSPRPSFSTSSCSRSDDDDDEEVVAEY